MTKLLTQDYIIISHLNRKFNEGQCHDPDSFQFSNSLLTKIRVGRSNLNQYKFTIGLADSPECLCHFREESPSHFFLDCFLYLPERQTLFDLLEHYIPKFKNLTKNRKLDIIMRGIDIENKDFIHLNTNSIICVKKIFCILIFEA